MCFPQRPIYFVKIATWLYKSVNQDVQIVLHSSGFFLRSLAFGCFQKDKKGVRQHKKTAKSGFQTFEKWNTLVRVIGILIDIFWEEQSSHHWLTLPSRWSIPLDSGLVFQFQNLHPCKFNMEAENRPGPNRKVLFQASFLKKGFCC